MIYPGTHIAIVGAGPSGLFAAECLLKQGFTVALYDRMPSAGRKFLVAGGHGGLNITNAAPAGEFPSYYGENAGRFSGYLGDFSPEDMRAWLAGLGVTVMTGTSGKIFPASVSTVEILDRWMNRLSSEPGFAFYPLHQWIGISDENLPVFDAGQEAPVIAGASAVLLALGGKSWPSTGSDGQWSSILAARGIRQEPFQSANCGFESDWSPFQIEKFQNVPLKNITLSVADKAVRGELMLTPYGIEGGVVYRLGASIRDEINRNGICTVHIDMLPDWTVPKIIARWGSGPGKDSLSNHYRKKFALDGASYALLAGTAKREELRDIEVAAPLLKRLPVVLRRPRPIDEAISSAGGVSFSGLDDRLMLTALPGWFCAGEMLDWESPTGGFLLQGCFSTAYRAARGAAEWLGSSSDTL